MNEQTPTTLSEFFLVLRRRRKIAGVVFLVMPLLALAISLSQERLYQAGGQVLIKRDNLANQLTNTADQTPTQDFARVSETQAELARSPELARRVLDGVGDTVTTPRAFLDNSSVTAQPNTDLLKFAVRDPRPSRARALVDRYTTAFVDYRRELDTASLVIARRELEQRISKLQRAENRANGRLLSSLLAKDDELRTLEALQTSNAAVVRRADEANVVQPRTIRNVVLGILLGIIAAIGAAILRDTLDRRVRTADEIQDLLAMPLLGRIPTPLRQKGREGDDELITLHQPQSWQTESFRLLRTNLAFSTLGAPLGAVMITSSVHAEGKSATVCNLAVTFARSGQDIILVDLDLRRPRVGEIFGIAPSPGVTEVLLGEVTLEDALRDVDVHADEASRTLTSGAGTGSLKVLSAGAVPPNVGEMVSSRQLRALLDDLKGRGATLFIDAPPLLDLGDAMSISAQVNSWIVITRLGIVRRPMLKELVRLLDASPADVLGFVVTGADREDSFASGYGYGYGYGYGPQAVPAGRDS